MAGKVIMLSGLPAYKPKQHSRCTPVKAWSEPLTAYVVICREQIEGGETPMTSVVQAPPGAQTIDLTQAAYPALPPAPPKRRRGRPRGTEPGSISPVTGKRVKAPTWHGREIPACSRDTVKVVRMRNGKKRCKCTSPGNKQFVPNRMCEHLPEWKT